MVEVRPTLKNIMNYIKSLQEYFSLKDKVLWTGSWSSGSITVPDTAKYSKFKINIGTAYMDVLKTGNALKGTISFRGSDGTTIYQNVFQAAISGNTWTISAHGQASHKSGSNHGTFVNTLVVTEIIGSEPIAPESLGGGITLTGGGCHAISNNYHKGRVAATKTAQMAHNSLRYAGEQIHRISERIKDLLGKSRKSKERRGFYNSGAIHRRGCGRLSDIQCTVEHSLHSSPCSQGECGISVGMGYVHERGDDKHYIDVLLSGNRLLTIGGAVYA